MEKLSREFITSSITVVFAILAIAIFIHSGATLIFYVAVAIAIIIGFYNAWQISLGEQSAAIRSTAQKSQTKRRRR